MPEESAQGRSLSFILILFVFVCRSCHEFGVPSKVFDFVLHLTTDVCKTSASARRVLMWVVVVFYCVCLTHILHFRPVFFLVDVGVWWWGVGAPTQNDNDEIGCVWVFVSVCSFFFFPSRSFFL